MATDEILANNPDILEDSAPTVIFEDFGDSALIFDAFFWIGSTSGSTLRGVTGTLRFEIARVFKENDVVIAFPQRDIHLDGLLKLDKSLRMLWPRTGARSPGRTSAFLR